MKVKELFARFRAWQTSPFHYSDEGLEEHHCANCDHTYTGNYCPVCGQAADVGRITWQSVWKNVLSVWGMESKSLVYSLWQLLWRPGYLISDYINGHRQQSYSPTSMLFIVALFYALVTKWINPVPIDIVAEDEDDLIILLNAINWLINNPGWGIMTITMFFIIPTWALFRFSPRNNHHTLPQGAFIQLFMGTLLLMCIFFSEIISNYLKWLIPIYYYIAYRQLFGYRFWGTTWRLLLIVNIWFLAILILISMAILFERISTYPTPEFIGFLVFELVLLLFIFIILFIGYRISKRTSQARTDTTC